MGLAEETLAGEFDARVQLQLVELLAARVDVTEGADRDALAPPVLALVELLEAGSSERVLEAVAVALGQPEAAPPVVLPGARRARGRRRERKGPVEAGGGARYVPRCRVEERS